MRLWVGAKWVDIATNPMVRRGLQLYDTDALRLRDWLIEIYGDPGLDNTEDEVEQHTSEDERA